MRILINIELNRINMHPFLLGKEYRRGDLLDFVGSKQGQSGVLWGDREAGCLICTSGGRHGKKAGYTDEILDDGSWWYFGQGQKGALLHKSSDGEG
jgi:5-methylcytosine-specific restriction protein A